MQRVFGGQVAGQALVAAGRTVPRDRTVHSLHSYFIRPGDPTVPIVYEVDRVRDGRSFTTRRVVAVQHGKPIFTLSASFQLRAARHRPPAADARRARARRRCRRWRSGTPTSPEAAAVLRDAARPIDLRYVDDPPWAAARARPARERSAPRLDARQRARCPTTRCCTSAR